MRYLTLSVTICAAIALLVSCSKKDKYPAVRPTYGMFAKIIKSADTIIFSAPGYSWVRAIDSNMQCKIFGSDTFSDAVVSSFRFRIYDYAGAGTYVFDSTSQSYADYETNDPVYSQTAFTYCVVHIISVVPDNVSGTFSGSLADGSVVTNGIFTVSGKGF
jgi:hypothetical protein